MKIQILTVLVVIAGVLVGWIELNWFPFIPVSFIGASKINSVTVNFSLAYISSYFFYVLVVYLKERKDRNNSIDYILTNSKAIVRIGDTLKRKIEEIGGIQIDSNTTTDDLNRILSTYRLDEQVANHNRLYNLSWEAYFKEISIESRELINKILSIIPYLDSNLVKILTNIYDLKLLDLSSKIAPANLLRNLPVQLNVSLYSVFIIEYLENLDHLQKYISKNQKIDNK